MIKLFSLNIEGDKHIDRIIPFLRKEKPDIVCFQEVFKADISYFEKELGMKAYFTPTMNVCKTNPFLAPKGLWGLAIFSKQKPVLFTEYYYVGKRSNIPQFIYENPNSGNRAVSWITFQIKNKTYTIATTHFTWSPKGEETEEQRSNMEKLLIQLKKMEPFILCGDFNAPRGKSIYKMLEDVYKDNIPKEITSTIDPILHRERELSFVVDSLFTTSQYIIDAIDIVGGLSDHKGICAILK